MTTVTRRGFLAGVTAAATVPMLGGWPRGALAQQPAIRIGGLAGPTGPIAIYGQNLHNSRLMAVDEINAKGGVNVKGTKHRLEMTHLDVGSPSEAIKVFERLLSVEKVKLVVDGLYS